METPESAAPPTGAKGAMEIREVTRGERTIIRRVAEARATVPHLELSAVLDVSAWVQAQPAGDLTPGHAVATAHLVHAVARALRESPRANAAYRDGHLELYERINVAVVLPAADAYAAPVIPDADRLGVAQLESTLARLQTRAMAGELTGADLAGATFTVMNLPGRHTSRASLVPVAPQAAGLAAGAVRPAAVVRDGQVVAGHLLELTLVCDHRILYGAPAAELLDRIAELLTPGPTDG